MPQLRNPASGDILNVHADLLDYFQRQGWERVYSDEEIENLKGASLDDALNHAGLPKSGKADEKRERLADNTPKEN